MLVMLLYAFFICCLHSDSTSGGTVGLQSRRRSSLRSTLIHPMVNKKMQSLSLEGTGPGCLPPLGPDMFSGSILPSLPGTKSEQPNSPYLYNPRNINGKLILLFVYSIQCVYR